MNHKLIKEKTSNKLENRAKKQGTYNVREIAKIIRKELSCFKQEKVRGKYLDLIYKYLLTIFSCGIIVYQNKIIIE